MENLLCYYWNITVSKRSENTFNVKRMSEDEAFMCVRHDGKGTHQQPDRENINVHQSKKLLY